MWLPGWLRLLRGIIACVASVSNRVIARKLERERKKKKNGRGRGRGEEETSFPSPSPVTPFFLLSSQLPRRTRAATLATQARAITDVPGDIMCGSHHNSYFFILLRLSEWRSTTTLFLLDLPARSRSMYFWQDFWVQTRQIQNSFSRFGAKVWNEIP